MERAAGLTHDDASQAKLDKLDAVLAQTSTSIEDASLFAEMLSLPNDGRYPTIDLTPQQRRQATLIGGTGKYAGITGGTTDELFHPQFKVSADNTYVQLVKFEGSYKLP
jgi:hypothetical protein